MAKKFVLANPIHVSPGQWLAGSYFFCKSLRSPSLDSEKTTLTHLVFGHRLFSVWSGVWRSSLHLDLAPPLFWDPLGPALSLLWLSLAWDITSSDVESHCSSLWQPQYSLLSATHPPSLVSFTKQVWVARSPPPYLGSGRIGSPYLGLSCCFISWSSVLYECK